MCGLKKNNKRIAMHLPSVFRIKQYQYLRSLLCTLSLMMSSILTTHPLGNRTLKLCEKLFLTSINCFITCACT